MKSPSETYKILGVAGNQQKRKFGNVYFGEHKLSAERVIIKHIAKTSSNLLIQDRLREESTYTFDTDGLPKVLDWFESESEMLLVLQYREGIQLDTYAGSLRQKDKPKFILGFLEELAPLFDKLSKNEIAHLDLKPGNFLVEQSKEGMKVSLIDFGMAGKFHEKKERSTLFPLGYAAPELILNRLDLIDQTTDIFALGICLWQIFTGKIPLLHPNPSVTTNLQITHPLPAHEKIPSRYFSILEKMTAKHTYAKPPDRYSFEENELFLKAAMDQRYSNISAVIKDWEGAIIKRNRFGF